MNTRIKNYLGIALIAATLAFTLGVVSYVATYARTVGTTAPSFTVEGRGEATAVPDVAEFTFGVITEGSEDLTRLQGENATRVNRAIEYLKGEGVAGEDIQTQRVDISPRYRGFNCFVESGPCPPPEIVGYSVNQSVRVTVRDLDAVGELFAGVVESGANTASNLAFTIDDPVAFENEARAKAIEQARRKAEAIAEAGDFRLGQLLEVTEGGGVSPVFGIGGAETTRFDNAVAPAIEPGSEEIVKTIILRYEIR